MKHPLHALCPYFAMFPPEFVRENVERFSKAGDLILDPFSGRGTTILESLLLGRRAIAGDINPVAYCISSAKANVPKLANILSELDELKERYTRCRRMASARSKLPVFFDYAFHADTLDQLLFLQRVLEWRRKKIHRFIAALVLGHLHGESKRSGFYFTNQMPHSISSKPDYSVRYWREHNLKAPFRDVFEVLRDRASFRLRVDRPERQGRVALSDARAIFKAFRGHSRAVRLVITSPPYLDMTNYEEDQWLRLWFLGGPPRPVYGRISRDDRHRGPLSYWEFIQDAWHGVRPLLANGAVLVCRMGAKNMSAHTLVEHYVCSIKKVWPGARMLSRPVLSQPKSSQMSVLNPSASGCRYEMDFTFALR